MKNYLDYILIPFGVFFIALYLFLGGIFDVCTKIAAAFLCLIITLVCVIIIPFLPKRPRFHKLRSLYDYGGKWGFYGDNYYITNKLLNKYSYDRDH